MDFGLSRDLSNDEVYYPAHSWLSSAPEVCKKKKPTMASDYYSFGITVTVMFHIVRVVTIKHFGTWWINTRSKDGNQLIRQCLKKCPEDRPKSLLDHKYFDNVSVIPSYKPGKYRQYLNRQTPNENRMKCEAVTSECATTLIHDTLKIPSPEYLNEFH